MKMRSLLPALMILLSSAIRLQAQTPGNSTTEVILSNSTARAFSNKPVTDSEIDLIIRCGIRAPSARNIQPWKFTVVKDQELVSNIIANITEGNILIVVSGVEAQQPGMLPDFDCALATQNMFISAQSMGLGAHIYTGPINNINLEYKDALGIPDGYRAISVLRIGNLDQSVDAVSSASTRKEIGEIVNYR